MFIQHVGPTCVIILYYVWYFYYCTFLPMYSCYCYNVKCIFMLEAVKTFIQLPTCSDCLPNYPLTPRPLTKTHEDYTRISLCPDTKVSFLNSNYRIRKNIHSEPHSNSLWIISYRLNRYVGARETKGLLTQLWVNGLSTTPAKRATPCELWNCAT